MQKLLMMALMLLFSSIVSADTNCTGDKKAEICIAVQNTGLDCNKAASSDYLSHCIATVAYDITNNLNDDIETKASCNVEINYLKSVMGIRDTGQQRNSQTHALSANSSSSFAMPVMFKFSLQTEASNVKIKAVSCRIDSTRP